LAKGGAEKEIMCRRTKILFLGAQNEARFYAPGRDEGGGWGQGTHDSKVIEKPIA